MRHTPWRIALFVLAVLAGTTMVVVSVVREPASEPGLDHSRVGPLTGTTLSLAGPHAPTARALPGGIEIALGSCAAGWIDLNRAEVDTADVDASCESRSAPDANARAASGRGIRTGALDPPILLDETVTLSEEEISAHLAGEQAELLGVAGYDVVESGLAAVLVMQRNGKRLTQELQLWRGEEFERSLVFARASPGSVSRAGDFGASGRRLQLSPDARELAVASERAGSRVTLVDLSTGRQVLLPPVRGFDWSPDGRWLALSTGEDVLVYGASRTAHVYVLEVAADDIDWRSRRESPNETP